MSLGLQTTSESSKRKCQGDPRAVKNIGTKEKKKKNTILAAGETGGFMGPRRG